MTVFSRVARAMGAFANGALGRRRTARGRVALGRAATGLVASAHPVIVACVHTGPAIAKRRLPGIPALLLALAVPVAPPVGAQEGRGVIYLADREHGTMAYSPQRVPLGPVQDPTAMPLPLIVTRNALPPSAEGSRPVEPRRSAAALPPDVPPNLARPRSTLLPAEGRRGTGSPRPSRQAAPRISTQGAPAAVPMPPPRVGPSGGQVLQMDGASGGGQWMVTAQGCTYSRAQAPGRAPTWHLVLNPNHVGQPPSGRVCAAILR